MVNGKLPKHYKKALDDIEIICTELLKKLKCKEQECDELKAKIRYMEEYTKTVENSRNEFEKENIFLKRILQKTNEVLNDRPEQN